MFSKKIIVLCLFLIVGGLICAGTVSAGPCHTTITQKDENGSIVHIIASHDSKVVKWNEKFVVIPIYELQYQDPKVVKWIEKGEKCVKETKEKDDVTLHSNPIYTESTDIPITKKLGEVKCINAVCNNATANVTIVEPSEVKCVDAISIGSTDIPIAKKTA